MTSITRCGKACQKNGIRTCLREEKVLPCEHDIFRWLTPFESFISSHLKTAFHSVRDRCSREGKERNKEVVEIRDQLKG